LLQNSRDSKLVYGENLKSLSHLVSKWYRVVTNEQTDKQTDKITVANMRYMLSHVKNRMHVTKQI